MIDVNPGEFGNIHALTKDRNRKTTLSIHRQGASATRVPLPVLRRPLGDAEVITKLGGPGTKSELEQALGSPELFLTIFKQFSASRDPFVAKFSKPRPTARKPKANRRNQ